MKRRADHLLLGAPDVRHLDHGEAAAVATALQAGHPGAAQYLGLDGLRPRHRMGRSDRSSGGGQQTASIAGDVGCERARPSTWGAAEPGSSSGKSRRTGSSAIQGRWLRDRAAESREPERRDRRPPLPHRDSGRGGCTQRPHRPGSAFGPATGNKPQHRLAVASSLNPAQPPAPPAPPHNHWRERRTSRRGGHPLLLTRRPRDHTLTTLSSRAGPLLGRVWHASDGAACFMPPHGSLAPPCDEHYPGSARPSYPDRLLPQHPPYLLH